MWEPSRGCDVHTPLNPELRWTCDTCTFNQVSSSSKRDQISVWAFYMWEPRGCASSAELKWKNWMWMSESCSRYFYHKLMQKNSPERKKLSICWTQTLSVVCHTSDETCGSADFTECRKMKLPALTHLGSVWCHRRHRNTWSLYLMYCSTPQSCVSTVSARVSWVL